MTKPTTDRSRVSTRVKRVLGELLVAPPKGRGRKPETVAFQWHDGAGELHYEVLSPAQSWPYLSKN
ncbi:MAG: hypothetical protein IPL64_16840 [Flavobacteriales bacterium]|nr:hypothetical protein [Flavobacteriales bacterium]MBK6549434.1 hypothetical protein [Flavobacteriales bacterium]MBK7481196.1 hypothetical protein [Flavobacteriales bacterium]MBK7617914.1 hypothetical protein [Flavobacteriales bacterium]MBK8533531.1 hypothetical protein [Flavobacteriales bacterium]